MSVNEKRSRLSEHGEGDRCLSKVKEMGRKHDGVT